MHKWTLDTPILFLIFKRPDTTGIVFEEIRKAQPPRLYIAADGPRHDKPGESEKVTETRQLVLSNIDWNCEVKTLFRDENLGCRWAVSGAIDWFFDQETAGIILEDDCLPDQTFFRYCEDLLAYYRNDERIMCISGNNFQFGRQRTRYSYYFSRYSHVWGWASWKRAWQHYDSAMTRWPEIQDSCWLKDILTDQLSVTYWTQIFQKTFEEKIDSWAYRWLLSCWLQSGLSILPNKNLVSNIGFGNQATHTKEITSLAGIPAEEIVFPLRHPPYVIRDAQADRFTEKATIRSQSLTAKAKSAVNRVIHSLL